MSSQVAAAPLATTRKLGFAARTVKILSLANLVGLVLLAGLLWGVSERTWWGTLLTFFPRHPLLVAPILLLVGASCFHRRSIAVNLAALLIVVWPLMGARIPLTQWPWRSAPRNALKIVSCNVNLYRPDFPALLREIQNIEPDVVALQEAIPENPLCEQMFKGWHTIHEGEFWIGSRYPIRKMAACFPEPFRKERVLTVRIDAPQGPFLLHDVHLSTPRYGLLALSKDSLLHGEGPAKLATSTEDRFMEARHVHAYVVGRSKGFATIAVGDFNTPSSSNLYSSLWDEYQNAFDDIGIGLGYTCPVTGHRYWFDDVPWVRIDHILADPSWSIARCGIGSGTGSDHHLIWADLSR